MLHWNTSAYTNIILPLRCAMQYFECNDCMWKCMYQTKHRYWWISVWCRLVISHHLIIYKYIMCSTIASSIVAVPCNTTLNTTSQQESEDFVPLLEVAKGSYLAHISRANYGCFFNLVGDRCSKGTQREQYVSKSACIRFFVRHIETEDKCLLDLPRTASDLTESEVYDTSLSCPVSLQYV